MELLLDFGSTRLGDYPSHSNSLTYGPTFSWLYQHPLTSQAMRPNIILYIANHQWITYLHIVLQFMLRPIQRPLVFIVRHLVYCFLFTIQLTQHHQGYRPAEVRLVFRPCKNSKHHDPNAEQYALVFWYSKIPSRPNRETQMYEVHQEFDMQGERKSGVVRLSSIKGLCPLAPLIIGDCPSELSTKTCFERISQYYINCYSSHSHFRQLRD